MPITLDDLEAMDADALDHAMRNGHPIDEDVLADREYDGVSLNLPAVIERLTWLKFCKVFHREPDGSLRGWNCEVEQTSLAEPWVLRRKNGEPISYGHYRVVPVDGYRMPRPYDGGLMLDYGIAGNRRADPSAAVRDPLVAVNPGDSTLLLGWTYVDAKIARVGTPSYFALRRGVALSHVVAPPRA